MPRNATGGYTLPAGNPVVTGTIIASGWANPTMADIQLALTDSLSRSGNGGMLAPFKVPDGSNINPSLSFVNEATSGLYRFGANDIRMAVGTTDRMRWQGAGTPPQIYDEENDRWNDLGAGGVEWTHAPTIPAEVEQGVGYMTRGGQSTLMPASPITGQAVTFSDLDNDWSETNFLTLDGNGSTFTQGSQTTYDLDLKGAFAQFAYLDGQWQIVNFGRLSDAYGFDLDDYATLALVNSKPNDNLLINGGFDIWQRGTIFNASGYTADRWDTGAGGATNQWKIQELAGANATKIRTTKWMNWVKTVVGQNTGNINQKIENVRTGGGSVVTLSFWAREVSNASKDFTVSATQVFGTGGDPDTSVSIGNYTIGGSAWTYYTFTFTLPEISNLAVIGANNHLKIQFSPVNAADTFNLGITAVKLEYGNTATPYQARPIGEELALCQRYYEKSYNLDLSAGSTGANGLVVWSSGLAQNSGRWQTSVPFKVTKRTSPSFTIYNSSTGVANQAFGYLGAATGTPMTAIYGSLGESMAQVSFEPRNNQSGYAFHFSADAEIY